MTDLIEILTGIGPALGAIAAIVLAFFGYGKLQKWSGRKEQKAKHKQAEIKAENETSERIDNAKPAENVDDARDSLAGFLHSDD